MSDNRNNCNNKTALDQIAGILAFIGWVYIFYHLFRAIGKGLAYLFQQIGRGLGLTAQHPPAEGTDTTRGALPESDDLWWHVNDLRLVKRSVELRKRVRQGESFSQIYEREEHKYSQNGQTETHEPSEQDSQTGVAKEEVDAYEQALKAELVSAIARKDPNDALHSLFQGAPEHIQQRLLEYVDGTRKPSEIYLPRLKQAISQLKERESDRAYQAIKPFIEPDHGAPGTDWAALLAAVRDLSARCKEIESSKARMRSALESLEFGPQHIPHSWGRLSVLSLAGVPARIEKEAVTPFLGHLSDMDPMADVPQLAKVATLREVASEMDAEVTGLRQRYEGFLQVVNMSTFPWRRPQIHGEGMFRYSLLATLGIAPLLFIAGGIAENQAPLSVTVTLLCTAVVALIGGLVGHEAGYGRMIETATRGLLVAGDPPATTSRAGSKENSDTEASHIEPTKLSFKSKRNAAMVALTLALLTALTVTLGPAGEQKGQWGEAVAINDAEDVLQQHLGMSSMPESSNGELLQYDEAGQRGHIQVVRLEYANRLVDSEMGAECFYVPFITEPKDNNLRWISDDIGACSSFGDHSPGTVAANLASALHRSVDQ